MHYSRYTSPPVSLHDDFLLKQYSIRSNREYIRRVLYSIKRSNITEIKDAWILSLFSRKQAFLSDQFEAKIKPAFASEILPQPSTSLLTFSSSLKKEREKQRQPEESKNLQVFAFNERQVLE